MCLGTVYALSNVPMYMVSFNIVSGYPIHSKGHEVSSSVVKCCLINFYKIPKYNKDVGRYFYDGCQRVNIIMTISSHNSFKL